MGAFRDIIYPEPLPTPRVETILLGYGGNFTGNVKGAEKGAQSVTQARLRRYDYICTLSLDDLAVFLCNCTDCENCIAADFCAPGHNGIAAWLREDITKEDEV